MVDPNSNSENKLVAAFCAGSLTLIVLVIGDN